MNGKMKWVRKLSWLIYIIIPTVLSLIFVALRLAQGEKTEEIAFGIELGLVVDLLLYIVCKLIGMIKSRMSSKQRSRNCR